MPDIVAHIKELLFARGWYREQIVERGDSALIEEWKCLLCVNEQPLAIVRASDDDGMCDDNVNLILTEMAKHTVKVCFAYHHQDEIQLVSNLFQEVEVKQMDEFMSPGELLTFIYGYSDQSSPLLILLPKLLKGTLYLFMAFIGGLFVLFSKLGKTLGYYEPLDRFSNLSDENSLYDYLGNNFSEYRIDPSFNNTDRPIPIAILIPYEAQTLLTGNLQIDRNAFSFLRGGEIVSGSSHSYNERSIKLSLDDIRERNRIYSEIEGLYEHQQKDYTVEPNPSASKNFKNFTIEGLEHEPSCSVPFSEEASQSSVSVQVPTNEKKYIKKYPKYEKIIINEINMARQTSYQTQIELASDLKRYLHGFQERLAEVAKNYQTKSHDLYEAGMMDETHKDFEENYVRETVAHIAGVVELINERDIPFVQKYIDKMEELRDQYGK